MDRNKSYIGNGNSLHRLTMRLGISANIASITTAMASVSAKVRDIWNSISDTCQNESRKLEDII